MRPLVALLLVALPLLAAPVPKGMKNKPSSPDGQWKLVAHSSDGKEAPLTNMACYWRIADDAIQCNSTGWPKPGEPSSSIAAKDPARPGQRVWGQLPAVVEVDGDTLRACYAHDGRKELSECKPGQGIAYYVFERVKAEK